MVTEGKVVEFGSGHGSTPFLREYCKKYGRKFETYDNNIDWARQTKAKLVGDWGRLKPRDIDVLLIDHAPGERRRFDIQKYANEAKIIICHDTEPAADHGYQMRGEFQRFKHKAELKTEGAWATALSNFINVSQFVGVTWNNYKVRPYSKY